MINRLPKVLILSLCVLLYSCDGGPKINGAAPKGNTPGGLTASVSDGKIYYETNCGGCHKAGSDDLNAVFGATDLILNENISNNLSQYGGKNNFLMKRFTNISKQRVLDLKAYLNQLKP